MGDFKGGGGRRSTNNGGGFGGRSGGGRSNFSRQGGGGFGGRDRGPVTMHQTVCDKCGNSCEVPFRPTEGKPVYCSSCFEKKEGGGNDRGRDRFPRKDFNSYESPVKNNTDGGNNDNLKKQLELLNVKMDRLIKAVEIIANTQPSIVEKTKEIEKKVVTAKAEKTSKTANKKAKK